MSASTFIMSIFPLALINIVREYYGNPDFKLFTVEDLVIYRNLFNLKNSFMRSILPNLYILYNAKKSHYVEFVYKEFNYSRDQLIEMHYVTEKTSKNSALTYANRRNDFQFVEWCKLVFTDTTKIPKSRYELESMFIKDGTKSLGEYMELLAELGMLDVKTWKVYIHSNVCSIIIRNANLSHFKWFCKMINYKFSLDYNNSVFVRRVYRVNGFLGLADLVKKNIHISAENIQSAEDEIIHRAIRFGDIEGMKWLINMYGIEICRHYRLDYYVHRKGKKLGHHKFIEWWNEVFQK
jgi:hypothetical protein